MRLKLRACLWAVGCALIVFGPGSRLQAWRFCHGDDTLGGFNGVAQWKTSVWGALERLDDVDDLAEWLPGGPCSLNFRPTLVLLSVTILTGFAAYRSSLWLYRRLPEAPPPEPTQEVRDYGESRRTGA
jgi:hypothetical protein